MSPSSRTVARAGTRPLKNAISFRANGRCRGGIDRLMGGNGTLPRAPRVHAPGSAAAELLDAVLTVSTSR